MVSTWNSTKVISCTVPHLKQIQGEEGAKINQNMAKTRINYVSLKCVYLENETRYSKSDLIFGKPVKFYILMDHFFFSISIRLTLNNDVKIEQRSKKT